MFGQGDQKKASLKVFVFVASLELLKPIFNFIFAPFEECVFAEQFLP
jgi:hypothetical protein